MKRKDLIIIVSVIIFSIIVSYILSSILISGPGNKQQVEVVSQISSEFTSPSSKYFNAQSIDPTQLIQITNNSNQTPFAATNK